MKMLEVVQLAGPLLMLVVPIKIMIIEKTRFE